MSLSSSGRKIDQLYLSPKLVTYASTVLSMKNNPDAITKEKIIEMLTLENEYRLSKKWLELMEQESKEMEYPMKTIDLLQTEVVKACGFKTEAQIENAIEFLRSASALYPNDEEILNAANYLKVNKMKPFNPYLYGAKYVDCALNNCKLSDLLNKASDKGYKYHFLISVSVT